MLEYKIRDDNERTRYIDLDNGNVLNLTRTDPYGWWHLSLGKGPLPDKFTGSYSSWEELEKAVFIYLRERELAVSTVKVVPPTPPELKRKKD